jgi:hypothetical protein
MPDRKKSTNRQTENEMNPWISGQSFVMRKIKEANPQELYITHIQPSFISKPSILAV